MSIEGILNIRMMAMIDQETQQEDAAERALEQRLGIVFPRCPVCGGRRRKHMLGQACAYCGAVRRWEDDETRP